MAGLPTNTVSHNFSNVRVEGHASAHLGDKTYHINTLDGDLAALDRLQPVNNARWDSSDNARRHRACHPDTRVEVLRQIREWATSDSSRGIFWLAGMAGTGKSTIAMSICQALQDAEWSVASFCFQRGAGDLASAQKVIPTLSYQLSTQNSAFGQTFRKAVVDTIHRRPDIITDGMGNQMQQLLIEPLQVSARSADCRGSQIIVVDALDECDNDELIHALLQLLGTLRTSHHLGLSILLTSRMDWTIRSFFLEAPDVTHQELLLHDVDRSTVDWDIGHYLQSELDSLARLRSVKQPWPLEKQVQELVGLAAGLFIFAATSVRFVVGKGKLVKPADRLAKLCNRDHWKSKSIATEELDSMYSFILTDALDGEYEPEEFDDAQSMFHRILEILVLTFTSVSVLTISALTEISEEDVAQVLRALHAVIGVSDDGHVWILHESFGDFLRAGDRCAKLPQMYVPHEPGHRQLLSYCLRTMDNLLTENICQLESTGSDLDSIADCKIDISIPAELQYACLHWHKHFIESGTYSEDWAAAHDFFKSHALKYLEVMAILQKLSECVLLLADLEARASDQADVRGMFYDLRRFILSYRTGIEQAPLQVYPLAAHFAPTETVMRSFPNETAKRYWIKTQPPRQWSGCVLTVESTMSRIARVAFSSDVSRIGLVMVYEADDARIIIMETATGGMLELYRHTASDPCRPGWGYPGLFLSDTGSILGFSISDGTNKIFNTSTTICLFSAVDQTLEGISPNGMYFITRFNQSHHSWAGTLGVWDTATGVLRYRIPDPKLAVLDFGTTKLVVGLKSFQNAFDLRVYDIESGDVCFASLDPANVLSTPSLAAKIQKVVLSKYEDTLLVIAHRPRGPHRIIYPNDDDSQCYSVVYCLNLPKGVWSPLLGHEDPEYAYYAISVVDERPLVRDVYIKGEARDAEFIVHSTKKSARDGPERHTQEIWSVQTFTQMGGSTPRLFREQNYRGLLEERAKCNIIGNGRYLCVDSSLAELRDRCLKVYDLDSQDLGPSCTLRTPYYTSLGYCNMRPIVFIDGHPGALEVYDVSGQVRDQYDEERIKATAQLSPDGTLLATAGPRDGIRLWSVADGTCSQKYVGDTLYNSLGEDQATLSFAIASDNSVVAIMVEYTKGYNQYIVQCWLWGRDSEPELLTRLPDGFIHRCEFQFSPDDLEIWFRSETESFGEPVISWQRFSRTERRLLDAPNNIDGWRMGTGKRGKITVDQKKNHWLIKDDGTTEGCRLAWQPNDYRSHWGFWSEPLQTVILHSKTGKVTFIKLNE